MSAEKKSIRDNFRTACFKRDGHRCVKCRELGYEAGAIDAHHITNRDQMPNGGYVLENGISLCSECHLEAEKYHWQKTFPSKLYPGFAPDHLYKLIDSSKEKAIEAASTHSLK